MTSLGLLEHALKKVTIKKVVKIRFMTFSSFHLGTLPPDDFFALFTQRTNTICMFAIKPVPIEFRYATAH